VGFAGGLWRGNVFAYNTAVVHVNNRFVHTTYVDRNIVEHNTIVNDRHVAFSGGPGGINHAASPEERMAEHDQHLGRTSFQTQHVNDAMHDRNAYASHNGGRPSNLVAARPLPAENHPEPRPVINNHNTTINRNVTVERNNQNTVNRNSNNGGHSDNGSHPNEHPAPRNENHGNENHGNDNHGGHNDGHGHGR
jgi:hypothetical protein